MKTSGVIIKKDIKSVLLFISINGFLLILSGFGFDGASEKRISEKKEFKRYFLASYTSPLPFILLVAVLILLFKEYVNAYIGLNAAFLIIISIITSHYYQNGLAISRAKDKFIFSGAIEGSQKLVLTFLQILAAITTGKAEALIFVFIFTHFSLSILCILIIFEKPELKKDKYHKKGDN